MSLIETNPTPDTTTFHSPHNLEERQATARKLYSVNTFYNTIINGLNTADGPRLQGVIDAARKWINNPLAKKAFPGIDELELVPGNGVLTFQSSDHSQHETHRRVGLGDLRDKITELGKDLGFPPREF